MTSLNILDNNETNVLIKRFSRNFTQNFNSLRISSLGNKNDYESTKKNIRNKEKIDSTKYSDKTLFNSLFDYDYFNASSKRNKNKSFKNIFTNKNSRKKSYQSKSSLNKYKSFQTLASKFSNSMKEINKRIINISNKLIDKSKNKNKNLSNIKIEPIYKRLFESKKNKERSMNNLRAKFLEKENSEFSHHPKISKNSLFLIKKKYDKNALYQRSQMKEKKLEKNFSDFYTKTLKENLSCSFFEKSFNHSREKNSRFYENNINWKNGIEQKIKNEKIKKEQNQQNIINKYKFKPTMNKYSLNMMKKNDIEEHKELNIKKIDLYNDKDIEENNKRKSLDKYKAKLKNIINNIYNDNGFNSNMHKKKIKMKRTNSNINLFNKNMNINKKLYKNKNMIKKSNSKMKTKNRKNEVKKEEENKAKEEKINKKDINGNFNKINKYTYIFEKNKKIRKKRNEKQKENDIYELYKINVNDGSAWMQQTLNNIPFDKKYKKLIKKSIL